VTTAQTILQTGQLTCHDARGKRIACSGSGQDAEYSKGLQWPENRFVPQDGIVLDKLTGLLWSRDANLAEYPLTWREALSSVDRINKEQLLGFSDWRLPNRRELRSLISHQAKHPALPANHPFVNVFSSWYWSSTSAVVSPAHAWYVDMDGGRMFYGGKDQSFLLWPVRGAGSSVLPATGQRHCYDEMGTKIPCEGSGQDSELRCGVGWPDPRFDIGNDSVLDRLSGKCWTRLADSGPGAVSWEAAISAVQRLNHRCLQCKWRLPNINELESLVDCGCHHPALPDGHPFRCTQDVYWSSTTSLYEPDWAWALYLDKGAVGVGHKTQAHFHVWAVQDGRR
jgi:hypothetical protein